MAERSEKVTHSEKRDRMLEICEGNASERKTYDEKLVVVMRGRVMSVMMNSRYMDGRPRRWVA